MNAKMRALTICAIPVMTIASLLGCGGAPSGEPSTAATSVDGGANARATGTDKAVPDRTSHEHEH